MLRSLAFASLSVVSFASFLVSLLAAVEMQRADVHTLDSRGALLVACFAVALGWSLISAVACALSAAVSATILRDKIHAFETKRARMRRGY